MFGNGQRLTAVAVKYDTAIDRSSLSTSSFEVADRTVTNVYANTEPVKAGAWNRRRVRHHRAVARG